MLEACRHVCRYGDLKGERVFPDFKVQIIIALSTDENYFELQIALMFPVSLGTPLLACTTMLSPFK